MFNICILFNKKQYGKKEQHGLHVWNLSRNEEEKDK